MSLCYTFYCAVSSQTTDIYLYVYVALSAFAFYIKLHNITYVLPSAKSLFCSKNWFSSLHVAQSSIELFRIYSDPQRDKRRHTVSAVYRCIARSSSTLKRGNLTVHIIAKMYFEVPIISCHVMSCHVMSCHVMSCHVMSCHVMLRHVLAL